ncbi:MarR family winged helix-turn-helix transcriptional regulator [Vagococcus vulneris]|uniref:MarR family transcriptional regulator n=1 Tax=Vagococcus vulneris TaxID=1977869 RepID=A0A430A1C0_9ENTE|nr:MarR family transcriptional regulator [Vagococcus vulneris]RSU00164.1 MarR family transcriptional regulator [Vagococcus vulneris]
MDKRQELMTGLMDLLNEINYRNKPEMEAELSGMTLNEVELIELIAKEPSANVTRLAEATHMTRGAISKLTKKMIKRELIEMYQIPENRKETFFKLTKEGQLVFDKHQLLHQQWLERDAEVFNQLSDADYHVFFEFINRYQKKIAEDNVDKETK